MSSSFSNIGLSFSFLLLMLFGCSAQQEEMKPSTHPSLTLSSEGVATIKSQLGSIPLFDQALADAKKEMLAEIEKGIEVPVPKDMAGGYTHNTHKRNYINMQQCGVLFQITGDEVYATYIKSMLMEYAALFPTIGKHPSTRSYAPGKLFWQSLNDANWLVNTSQAYDCIYDWLSAEERAHLESKLFRPYADFLSVETPKFFNRIHNHSTWGCAAVGMIGLVMDDEKLVNRALYGLGSDGVEAGATDNDGGLINTYGEDAAGFLSQIDLLFSPDGYYTEGPYYQRYSLYPFLIFGKSLENSRPDLRIFDYRDGLLKKAVYALVNLTDSRGIFYPINDAQKGMSLFSNELISAIDIIYHQTGDGRLLDIATQQGRVLLDDSGLAVAQGLKDGLSSTFVKKSKEYTDGAKGDEGALGVLRSKKNLKASLLFKYAAQGMGHGHFDKLSISMYMDGKEVLQDYGAARFVNIEQKSGGRYLKENKSFAKHSIGHNTLVVNGKSHYGASVKVGNANHPEAYFFDADQDLVQIASAKDFNAYPDVVMQRTVAMIELPILDQPVILDLMSASAKKSNTYELPFYYDGQLLEMNFDYKKEATLAPMGEKYGYNHIWKEAESESNAENKNVSWFDGDQFFSLTTASSQPYQVVFGRVGANDPSFNLRNDPMVILKSKGVKDQLFASIIEPHGSYSPVTEWSTNPRSGVSDLTIDVHNKTYTAVHFSTRDSKQWQLVISNEDSAKESKHEIQLSNGKVAWEGPYKFYQLK